MAAKVKSNRKLAACMYIVWSSELTLSCYERAKVAVFQSIKAWMDMGLPEERRGATIPRGACRFD